MIADSAGLLGASPLFWMAADWSLVIMPPNCVVCQSSFPRDLFPFDHFKSVELIGITCG
jgi:hypothetical protein